MAAAGVDVFDSETLEKCEAEWQPGVRLLKSAHAVLLKVGPSRSTLMAAYDELWLRLSHAPLPGSASWCDGHRFVAETRKVTIRLNDIIEKILDDHEKASAAGSNDDFGDEVAGNCAGCD